MEFEKKIYNTLLYIYKKDIITIIPPDDNYSNYKIRDPIYYYITKLMINKGVPFIYQGVLHDKNKKTYGAPDIIIKSNYINKIFKTNITFKKICYYIIDIKNSIIHFGISCSGLRN
jgi:hypothetical protein